MENLTDTLARFPPANMTNSSDAIISSLKSVYQSLDTLGSPGFAYAFQDKIVSLYDTDVYLGRIA